MGHSPRPGAYPVRAETFDEKDQLTVCSVGLVAFEELLDAAWWHHGRRFPGRLTVGWATRAEATRTPQGARDERISSSAGGTPAA